MKPGGRTPRPIKGAVVHTDAICAPSWALQVVGTKRWTFARRTVRERGVPIGDEFYSDEVWTVDAKPGDLLCFFNGWHPHSTENYQNADQTASLHGVLTFPRLPERLWGAESVAWKVIAAGGGAMPSTRLMRFCTRRRRRIRGSRRRRGRGRDRQRVDAAVTRSSPQARTCGSTAASTWTASRRPTRARRRRPSRTRQSAGAGTCASSPTARMTTRRRRLTSAISRRRRLLIGTETETATSSWATPRAASASTKTLGHPSGPTSSSERGFRARPRLPGR